MPNRLKTLDNHVCDISDHYLISARLTPGCWTCQCWPGRDLPTCCNREFGRTSPRLIQEFHICFGSHCPGWFAWVVCYLTFRGCTFPISNRHRSSSRSRHPDQFLTWYGRILPARLERSLFRLVSSGRCESHKLQTDNPLRCAECFKIKVRAMVSSKFLFCIIPWKHIVVFLLGT